MSVDISLHCRAFGVPGGRPRDGLTIAPMAEAAGLRSIHLGDRVVMGNRTDRYPYGNFTQHAVVDSDTAWMEPLTTIAAMSMVTSRIKIGVNVLLAPLRPGAFLAEQIATLEAISQGRTEIAVGVGWQREELSALGWTGQGGGRSSGTTSRHAERCGASSPRPSPPTPSPSKTSPPIRCRSGGCRSSTASR